MKNLIKITALALVALFAVVSCAPDLAETAFDWAEANAHLDATESNPTGAAIEISDFAIITSGFDAYNREIGITFPRQADVLREATPSLGFLTFNRETTTAVTGAATGGASGHGTAVTFTFTRKVDNTIYGTLAGEHTDIIMSLNADTYTFAQGKKLAMDSIETTPVGDFIGLNDNTLFFSVGGDFEVAPTQRGYNININRNPAVSLPNGNMGTGPNSIYGTETSYNLTDYIAFTIALNGSTIGLNNDTVRSIMGGANRFSLERFRDGKWENAAASGSFIENTASIAFSFTAREFEPLRVKWDGPAVKASVFGVNQRLAVLGEGDTMWSYDTPMRHIYGRTVVYGEPTFWRNSARGNFGATATSSIYKMDSDRRNVVVEFVVPGANTYWMKQYTTEEIQKNFLVRRTDDITNPEYVKVTNVEFALTPGPALTHQWASTDRDIMRITLDPAFQLPEGLNNFHFCINKEIGTHVRNNLGVVNGSLLYFGAANVKNNFFASNTTTLN